MQEEIKQEFEDFGIEVSEEVIDKCVELCLKHNITDAADFVAQWMVFSVSNLNGACPTVGYLDEMERKELLGKKEKDSSASSKNKKVQRSGLSHLAEPNLLAIYGTSIAEENIDEGDDIMESYNCKTPKAPTKTISERTPASKGKLFSPTTYSPLSGTPRPQGEASGRVICRFGNSNLLKATAALSNEKKEISVNLIPMYKKETMTTKSKFMYDVLTEKASIQVDHVFNIGKGICQKVFGEDTLDYDLHNADIPSPVCIKTVGRICCEFDGKLDRTSTILIGADDMKFRSVRLNFDEAKSFAIFPGQIVMVSGINPQGETLYVEEIISERKLNLPEPPKCIQEINFTIACGPYTNHDDLVYEPLHDLIAYCKNNKPDVLIMMGPFVDADHTFIAENALGEAFESLFGKILDDIVEAVGNDTTVCIVSSQKDIICKMVYPTHPIETKRTYPNVHMLPDPSLVNINGITFGITSTDIVNHLMEEELATNNGDKVKRIVNYLFHQESFYPLNPPSFDICFDSYLANKFAKLNIIPNIMLLPSKQKCFIREVNNCLAINPGKLINENNRTFARLTVHPPKDEANLFNYIACQVMKI